MHGSYADVADVALGLPFLLRLADLIELPYVLMLLHKVCGRAPCPLASIQEEPTLCIPGPSTSGFTTLPGNPNAAYTSHQALLCKNLHILQKVSILTAFSTGIRSQTHRGWIRALAGFSRTYKRNICRRPLVIVTWG
jgi:hypothetical protein